MYLQRATLRLPVSVKFRSWIVGSARDSILSGSPQRWNAAVLKQGSGGEMRAWCMEPLG